jgi:hypothetical protein
MHRESESSQQAEARPGGRACQETAGPAANPHSGMRAWILENRRLICIFDLIAAYASLMVFVVSLFVIGKPNYASRLCLAIFIASAVVALVPLLLSRSGRSPKVAPGASGDNFQGRAKRGEIIIAAILWGCLAIVVAFLLILRRVAGA